MGNKGIGKYDYFGTSGKDCYGVDAPDFRDDAAWSDLLLAVTGVTLLFVGEPSTRQIKEQMCGWMPQGRDRQRYESHISDAIVTLEAGRILESYGGPLWIRYRSAPPIEPKKEVPIDREKFNEYKAWLRQQNESYPTYSPAF